MLRFVFLLCVGVVSCRHIRSVGDANEDDVVDKSFKWRNCAANPVMKVESMTVNPGPIIIPGQATVSINAEIREPPAGRPDWGKMNMEVEVIKVVPYIGEIRIPCIADVGSCTHEDVCAKLQDGLAREQDPAMAEEDKHITRMVGILRAGGIHPPCPWTGEQTFTLTNHVVEIPEPPMGLGAALSGVYKIKSRMVNEYGMELSCMEVEVTVEKKKNKDCWFWC